jgi:hypothetical protein
MIEPELGGTALTGTGDASREDEAVPRDTTEAHAAVTSNSTMTAAVFDIASR